MKKPPDEVDEAVYEYGVLVSRKSTGRRPNQRKRWLKAHPKGSAARQSWEESKALKERLAQILRDED